MCLCACATEIIACLWQVASGKAVISLPVATQLLAILEFQELAIELRVRCLPGTLLAGRYMYPARLCAYVKAVTIRWRKI